MSDELPTMSPGGSWIVRHADAGGEPPWQPGGFHDDLADALADAFAEPMILHQVFRDGDHIDVCVVPPNHTRPHQMLVTAGMSDTPMRLPAEYDGRTRLELVMALPAGWALTEETMKSENVFWPVRLLQGLARFPRRYDTFLDERHTVPNGDQPEPYAMNTKFVCALIAPAPFTGADLGGLRAADGTPVDFVSVIPIYRDEMELKLQRGAVALFERLRKAGVTEFVDVRRPSVCRRRLFGFF